MVTEIEICPVHPSRTQELDWFTSVCPSCILGHPAEVQELVEDKSAI
jgi:hypothetical protein